MKPTLFELSLTRDDEAALIAAADSLSRDDLEEIYEEARELVAAGRGHVSLGAKEMLALAQLASFAAHLIQSGILKRMAPVGVA